MKFKKILLMIISSVILMMSFFAEANGSSNASEFSANSKNITENFNSTFTLSEDSDLMFKYASRDLPDGSFIQLTHIESKKIIFSTKTMAAVDMYFDDLPKGQYQFDVFYDSGFLTYQIYTEKK